jgi:hypothetical protein
VKSKTTSRQLLPTTTVKENLQEENLFVFNSKPGDVSDVETVTINQESVLQEMLIVRVCMKQRLQN